MRTSCSADLCGLTSSLCISKPESAKILKSDSYVRWMYGELTSYYPEKDVPCMG